MTQNIKAVQTRRDNAEKRKAAYCEKIERIELITKTMTDVLADSLASSADKVKAAEILVICSKML